MRSNHETGIDTGGEHTDPSASGHLQKAQMDVIQRKDIRATSVETLADVSSSSIFVMILPAGFYNYTGLFEMGDSIRVEKCKERIVVVDGNNRRLLRMDDEDLSRVKRNQILDLNDEGDRWEGDVLNDEPFGWGVMYDKEGRKVYEGFRLGGVAACYGRKYYADISRVEYDGEWCGGRRWGRGIQYDRNGAVVYEGEWVDDGHLEGKIVITTKNHRFVNLHNRIEELHVESCCCNQKKWRVFDLSLAQSLKQLCVGDCCFKNVDELKLVGLSALESVVIGKTSFTEDSGAYNAKRRFCLKDCPRLRELTVGRNSFADFNACEIENLPALEEIVIGSVLDWSYNFYWSSLVLRSAW